ncbi:MAG: hypothetical protein K2N71_06545, partial [Oscillospiraceae bacterium]|nr:hypothetical protein [Oscillospiraceae bacterium]
LKTSEMTLEDIFLKITMGDNIVIKTKKAAETKADETVPDKAEEKAAEETAEKDDSKEDKE